LSNKRPQKPRSAEAKLAQTSAATDAARGVYYDYLYVWLERLFVAKMRSGDPWKNRAEAARELTEESKYVSKTVTHAIEIDKDSKWRSIEQPTKFLSISKDENRKGEKYRGYSMHLYRNKLPAWEKVHEIKYRK